jgi:putative hydrolase of the HAD superfamily
MGHAVRAVLFDLFGTLVRFRPRVPALEIGGQPWREAMHWLEPLVAEQLPDVPFPAFLEALLATTREIVAARAPEFQEVPSAERFRRALIRLGVAAGRAREVAPLLSARHMAHLTQETDPAPQAHDTLAALRPHVRLVLVSNFDHEPAALQVLEAHGLRAFFDLVLISAGFGRRKPHPSIFHAGLRPFQIAPAEALFVGDHYQEDIEGAAGAGLRPVWLCPDEPPLAPGQGVTVIRSLSEVVPLATRTSG